MFKSSRILAPAVAALALAAPAAQAHPAVDAPNHNSAAPELVAPMPSVQPRAEGFDWGSAAIGAGGVAGLVALLTAGTVVVGRNRVPSTR
jgi:hypothetical protein